MNHLSDLPGNVVEELDRFIAAAKAAWGDDLCSVVLYGSAAEGRLRLVSDVNLLLVLRKFDRAQTDRIRESLRAARAAIRLGVMFLLEEEIVPAAAAFAVKFDDIAARHRILYGKDPFEKLEVPRDEALAKVRQMLMNTSLRLREHYASLSLREEQLTQVIAETAGPLRTCAATILRLQGREARSPKDALALLVGEMNNPKISALLPAITEARNQGRLDPGAPGDLLFALMDLVANLQTAAGRLA